MKISILTLFPQMFGDFLNAPVIRRATEREIVQIEIVDVKTFVQGCFRKIDDSPFGGGPGMIVRCQPVLDALSAVCTPSSRTVLLSPKGTQFNQKKAHDFVGTEHLVLICGHYEGIDARVETHVDELLSLGDYVLTGGELASQVIADSVIRLLKGALREASTAEESHENGLLEYPQFTRPADFLGEKVPEVLLSGDPRKINDWQTTQSLLLTRKLRPDLFAKHVLTNREKKLLQKADLASKG